MSDDTDQNAPPPQISTEVISNALVLGAEQHKLGNLDEAERLFTHVLEVIPTHATALHMLGMVKADQGDLTSAADYLRRATVVEPKCAEHYLNLGTIQLTQQRLSRAAKTFRKAIEINPTLADAYFKLGEAFRLQNRPQEAAEAYKMATEAAPDDSIAFNNLAGSYVTLGRHADAEAAYRESVKLDPDNSQALGNLGAMLRSRKDFDGAVDVLQKALALNPDDPHIRSNLAAALREAGHLEDARATALTTLKNTPNNPDTLNVLGNISKDLGEYETAVDYYEKAVKSEPEYAQAHSNLGLTLLAMGDFDRGWREYAWRWKDPSFPRAIGEIPVPEWDGAAFDGKVLLVHAEQGIGDTLQFIRYIPLIKARGGTVIVACHSALVPLLQTVTGVDQFIAEGEPIPTFDLHIPMLNVAAIFATNVDTIPADVPYLAASAEKVEKWKARLGNPDFKVGVVWRGNPNHINDRNRSCPLNAFERLFQTKGATFFSLQKDARDSELDTLDGVVHLGPDLTDFSETAAAVESLDLVITVDTAVAHLAGALNKPCWVLLPQIPDWRWMVDRTDSPWYPNHVLYRQEERGNWDTVIDAVQNDLADKVKASS